MSELIGNLGIDWRLLLAQVINFVILFWVLKRFVFSPLAMFLEKRSKEIEKGLQDAQHAKEEREELRQLRTQIAKKAQEEASSVIDEARKKGSDEYDRYIKRAEEKIEQLAQKARTELAHEKEKMINQAKGELAGIAMMAAERLLSEKMNEEKDRHIIEKALREIT